MRGDEVNTTEAGEDEDNSDEIASVTECIPVDCMGGSCCSPSPVLVADVRSPKASVEDRSPDRTCVEGKLWNEDTSGVGVLFTSAGDDCVALERDSAVAG